MNGICLQTSALLSNPSFAHKFDINVSWEPYCGIYISQEQVACPSNLSPGPTTLCFIRRHHFISIKIHKFSAVIAIQMDTPACNNSGKMGKC